MIQKCGRSFAQDEFGKSHFAAECEAPGHFQAQKTAPEEALGCFQALETASKGALSQFGAPGTRPAVGVVGLAGNYWAEETFGFAASQDARPDHL